MDWEDLNLQGRRFFRNKFDGYDSYQLFHPSFSVPDLVLAAGEDYIEEDSWFKFSCWLRTNRKNRLFDLVFRDQYLVYYEEGRPVLDVVELGKKFREDVGPFRRVLQYGRFIMRKEIDGVEMYDHLQFLNWEKSLGWERPFLERLEMLRDVKSLDDGVVESFFM